MLEIPTPEASQGNLEFQRLWRFTLDPYRTVRRSTREVRIGDVGVGGNNPIRVQSMTIADTMNTPAVVDEICGLVRAGAEIVRVTAPNRSSAENLAIIKAELGKRGVHVPLVADIHFTPQAALIAALHVEKVRINPGNFADRKHFQQREYSAEEYARELERLETAFRPLVLRCKERGVAMRIGTNHGSLSDRILNRYGDTPLGMVESALEFVRICEHHGYHDLVLSMKASDVKIMIQAYRLLALRMRQLDMRYPFHLGVTEAGSELAARIKSALGIGALLADGIGDTVRVSLTEDSVHEMPVAHALCRAFQASIAAPVESARPADPNPPAWNPMQFSRRPAVAVGINQASLSPAQPPRVELVVCGTDASSGDSGPGSVATTLATLLADLPADLVLVQLLAPNEDQLRLLAELSGNPVPGRPAWGIELDAAGLENVAVAAGVTDTAWARLSLRLAAEVLDRSDWTARARACVAPVQYTLCLADGDPSRAMRDAGRLIAKITCGQLPQGGIALETSDWRAIVPAWRRLLADWPAAAPTLPIVLRAPRNAIPLGVRGPREGDAHCTWSELEVAIGLGGLLVDGCGDALQIVIDARDDALDGASRACRLMREILQATRLRLSQADFIACPSCGRTQFDLQTTTARIQARLRHLRGLKIAVMGCVVNGPGEMADADFGYVGSGPGKIDLYVGHERVERGIPAADAVDRLIDLIRQRGRWVEPNTPTGV